MNKEKEITCENEGETQVSPKFTQVGSGYAAGWESNAEIDCLLGHDTSHAGCSPLRQVDGVPHTAPAYDQEPDLCKRLLRGEGVEEFMHCRTLDQRKRLTKQSEPFVQQHVLVFCLRGDLLMTTPQPTRDAALSCALWSVLTISHP